MSEWYIRVITTSALCIIGTCIYWYFSPYMISILLLLMGLYILYKEYYPLYKKQYISSYSALLLIVSGFIALFFINHMHHASIIFPFMYAALADTSGYIVGNLIGSHRIAPTISPKKTWEGFIGSCIGASLGMYYLPFIDSTDTTMIGTTFTPILIGCCMATTGFLGDLCISQLKRNAHVKDTGTILPGHGGILDRFDSILAIALIVAMFISYTHVSPNVEQCLL